MFTGWTWFEWQKSVAKAQGCNLWLESCHLWFGFLYDSWIVNYDLRAFTKLATSVGSHHYANSDTVTVCLFLLFLSFSLFSLNLLPLSTIQFITLERKLNRTTYLSYQYFMTEILLKPWKFYAGWFWPLGELESLNQKETSPWPPFSCKYNQDCFLCRWMLPDAIYLNCKLSKKVTRINFLSKFAGEK